MYAPHIDEQRNDPRALAEGRAALAALPKEHLVKVVQMQKAEAETATSHLRHSWNAWWEYWESQVQFDGKEDWQSAIWVPKPFTTVEQATALIQRSLLDSPEFFGIVGVDPQDKLLASHIWKPILRLLLDQADFIGKFSDACKVGFITGVAGYLKFRWASSQTPILIGAQVDPDTGMIQPAFKYKNRSSLAIDFIPPWRIFRDPDSLARENFSGSYLYHSEWMGKPALRAMSYSGWDAEALERVLSQTRKGTEVGLTNSQQKEAERKQYVWERHALRREYLVDEGWLDVPDENGELMYPNALLHHCGGEILCGPKDNPLWATDLTTGRRKTPFVATAPIVHPNRFEGRGVIEQMEGLSRLYSNTFNLWADGLNWKVNPGTEVYQPGLVDWDDLEDYPGRLWTKNVKEQVLMPARRGEINMGEILAALNYIDSVSQNSSFVTDMAIGLPGYRSDVTKGEVQIKTAQSLAIFEAMGRNLEHGGRVAVELVYDLATQHLGGNDFMDPGISKILGPRLAVLASSMPLEERVANLQGQFDFTFTGVSQALQKADQLQKVMQAATLAMSPGFAGLTNPAQLLRIIFELLGVNDRIDVAEPPPPMPGGMPGMPGMPGAPMGAPSGAIQRPLGMMRAMGAQGGQPAPAPAMQGPPIG